MNQPPPPPDQPSRRLGPYEITRKLGEGGMGAVYLGRHSVLDVDHAIKVLPARLAKNEQFIERFLREARNAAKLHHPHIVQVVGADQYGEMRYIAMQFVPGLSLQAMVREATLSPWRAVRYCYHVANALAYAHSHGMIHRDVKPDNVLVDEADNARLTDFGLVRSAADAQGAGLTQSGAVLGTPYYMSPEQWKGDGVDHRSDVYALGVMLYYMTTGRYPFAGEGPAQILRAQLDGRPTDCRELCSAIDEQLAGVIHKAIDIRVEARQQTARELADDLQAWFGSHPNGEGITLDTSVGGTVVRTTSTGDFNSESARTLATADHAPVAMSGSATPGGPGSPTLTAPGAPPPPPPPPGSGLQFDSQGGFSGAGTFTPTHATGFTDPALQAKQMRMWIGVVSVLVLAVVALVVFVISRGDGPTTNAPPPPPPPVPGPQLMSDLTATETDPVRTAEPRFAIPGKAVGKSVTLNGDAYEMGAGVELTEGMNVLKLVVVGENGETAERTYYVVHDRTRPVIELALPGGTDGTDANRIVTHALQVELTGRVEDADSRVALLAERDGADDQDVTLESDGTFRHTVAVGERPVHVRLLATDRAGNRATRELTVVPEPPAFKDVTVGDVVDPENIVRVEDVNAPIPVRGMTTHAERVQVEIEGQPGMTLVSPMDCSFEIGWVPGSTGEHRVVLRATDAAGRTATETVSVTVRQRIYRRIPGSPDTVPEYERLTDGMVVVRIPAGDYRIGAPASANRPDSPLHTVTLSAYVIDKHEVTNAMYCRYLNAQSELARTPGAVFGTLLTRAATQLRFVSGEWRPGPGLASRPVVGVTWEGARAYARWADPQARLPTEAQWEAAARGADDDRNFPWGEPDEPDIDKVNYRGGGIGAGGAVDVGHRIAANGASPFGVQMMCGNVEEWCLDFYDETAYRSLDPTDPMLDTAPSGEPLRVVRGGSFGTRPRFDISQVRGLSPDDDDLRLWFRTRRNADEGAAFRGFRCAAPAPDRR